MTGVKIYAADPAHTIMIKLAMMTTSSDRWQPPSVVSLFWPKGNMNFWVWPLIPEGRTPVVCPFPACPVLSEQQLFKWAPAGFSLKPARAHQCFQAWVKLSLWWVRELQLYLWPFALCRIKEKVFSRSFKCTTKIFINALSSAVYFYLLFIQCVRDKHKLLTLTLPPVFIHSSTPVIIHPVSLPFSLLFVLAFFNGVSALFTSPGYFQTPWITVSKWGLRATRKCLIALLILCMCVQIQRVHTLTAQCFSCLFFHRTDVWGLEHE